MTNITEKEDLEIKEYEFLKRKVAHLKKQENKEEELENLDCFFREGIKRMELILEKMQEPFIFDPDFNLDAWLEELDEYKIG